MEDINFTLEEMVLEYSYDMCGRTDPDEVQKFIDQGADANYHFTIKDKEFFPLCRALNVSVASVLVKNGADLNKRNSKGQTALMLNKQASVLRFLVENGADVSCVDRQGRNAIFHHAGNIKVMVYLVINGCNPFIKDKAGRTIMHYMDLNKQKEFHAELSKLKQLIDKNRLH
ncbi:ankyrin repeat domain-containing protein [Pantoea allii]|nr:ankyrin repeat domain-containing protein [Pantoea allii]THB84436.1 ankyrin repeat domain-containing protein [Pantoea allii]